MANALPRIPFGRLSDRVDRGLMSVAGLCVFAMALAGTGMFRDVVSLSICAALLGLGMGIGFILAGAFSLVLTFGFFLLYRDGSGRKEAAA